MQAGIQRDNRREDLRRDFRRYSLRDRRNATQLDPTVMSIFSRTWERTHQIDSIMNPRDEDLLEEPFNGPPLQSNQQSSHFSR